MDLFNFSFDINTVLSIFTKVLIVFLILPIHEFAHAWAAHKMGDDTAAYKGRLTLNPLSHIDWFGAICLVLTGFGWAKPVPINPLKFKNMRLGVSLTAAAGPLSNLIVAFLATAGYRVILSTQRFADGIAELYQKYTDVDEVLMNPFMGSYVERAANGNSGMFFILYVLEIFIIINIGLAIFNLIPVPPLDGSKILSIFSNARIDSFIERYQMQISMVFMVVILSGVLTKPINFISDWVEQFFWFVTGFIPKLM